MMVIPGSGSFFNTSSQDVDLDPSFRLWSFLVKDGRAVVLPILIGTYERKMGYQFGNALGNESRQYVDYTTRLVKDFRRRTIDYLETRPDIDSSRIGYYSYSWGGWLASIIPAVEERLRLCIICTGGFLPRKVRPEVSEVKYAPRVRIPTLMLLGKYDLKLSPRNKRPADVRSVGERAMRTKISLFSRQTTISPSRILREKSCPGWTAISAPRSGDRRLGTA